MNGIKRAAYYLADCDNIMIMTHVRPDGDTLGCAFALSGALSSLGKRVCVVNADGLTDKYSFLAGDGVDVLRPPFEPDCVVAVDTAAPYMLGEAFAQYAARVDVVIDHHPGNTGYGREHNIVRPECAACGEAVYELIVALGVELTPTVARAVYTAVASDTGCFKYGNTTANTHRVAAACIDTGFDLPGINERLFGLKTRARFEIESMVYETLRLYDGGSIALIYLTQQMRVETGAVEDDIEELSAMSRQLAGVRCGITIKEAADGAYKISVRTDGSVNAREVCESMGGGGHLRASGAILRGVTLEQAIDRCVEAVRAFGSMGL